MYIELAVIEHRILHAVLSFLELTTRFLRLHAASHPVPRAIINCTRNRVGCSLARSQFCEGYFFSSQEAVATRHLHPLVQGTRTTRDRVYVDRVEEGLRAHCQ